MVGRLVIVFAALAALSAGRAYGAVDTMTDGDLCDDADDAPASLAAATATASISMPLAPPATAAAPVPGADGDLCHGDRLTDDPSCWPQSPTGAPPSGGLVGLGGPDASLIEAPALARPDCSLTSLPPAPAGAEHPGYARAVDRPPRSF